MAQTGFTPIQLYSTSTAAAVPTAASLTNSTLGSELAINITDGKLFYKDNANAVQVIGWKTVPTTAGGTGLTSYTAGDTLFYASGAALSKLAIGTAGQILTSTGSAPQWSTLSGVAVTTFSAGTTGFTPNSATSGAVTLAGTLATTNGGTGLTAFTTNGVLYASSTSALVTASTLLWDGTNLAIGPTSPVGANRILEVGTSSRAQTYVRMQCQTAGFVMSEYVAAGFDTLFVGLNNSGSAFNGIPNGAGGMLTAGAIPLVFATSATEAMRIHASRGVSIGNTTDPGAGNLSLNSVVSTNYFIAINSSTVTTIATGVSFLAVVRDRGNGDTAMILYENNVTPVIVSQTGSKFVTGAPGATQIRIQNLSGGGGITAISGSTLGVTNVNVSVLKNQ